MWKQLYRAAKAKQKLKLRVTLRDSDEEDKGPKPVTVEDEPEQENQDFAQTKPEAPLISTASSEIAGPVTEAPEPSPVPEVSLANTLYPTWDARLEAAMSKLQLDSQKSDETLATPKQQSIQMEPDSGMCVAPKAANFAVCCNNCDRTIPDAHYHCSTCDDGDFDLCPECVEKGVTCYNSDHWLLKRFVRGDFILVSTTERVSPKPKPAVKDIEVKAAPAAWPRIPSPASSPAARTFLPPLMRTCNSCVQELPDKEFLHCTTCEDFDLCKACFVGDKHGHHPKHGFTPAVEGTPMPSEVLRRLVPGRDQRHHAICDGCDKFIFGVRHKCLDCPDWDYCSACVVNAGFIHPNHRFVPVYEQIADARARTASRPCHYGICCDGPLCDGKRKAYIVGERYKCTVCHDTDFCANCEASPANTHNRTHPLIKFKTPVRRVEVTTKGEDENGQRMPVMGDRLSRKPVSSRATETSTATNSPTTSLHTVVDMKPTESEKEVEKDTISTRATALETSISLARIEQQRLVQLARRNVQSAQARMAQQAQQARQQGMMQQHKARMLLDAQRAASAIMATKQSLDTENLVAVFERDTIPDGTVMPPNQVFEQTWVLRNGGDISWPAGCSVKFVGGDYMGHIDSSHPAGIHELVSASESTVCYDALAPGKEFSFTVLLRTPAREGKVISWWRLTTKDGLKFGHRLWCDVTVQAPKAVEEPKEQDKEETPALVKQEATVDEPKADKTSESSQMIFPKLEKESPEASIHEDVKSDAGEVLDDSPADDFEDCGEDDAWAEDSDTGFLTDEEYDILDASDEEYLDEQQKKTQKK